MLQFSQKISALPEAFNKISICPKTDLGIIVVLGFRADHSVAQIRSSTDQFCRALKNVMEPSDKIRTGIGGSTLTPGQASPIFTRPPVKMGLAWNEEISCSRLKLRVFPPKNCSRLKTPKNQPVLVSQDGLFCKFIFAF